MDDKLIATAKAHARDSGRSVSQLVADYFKLLGAKARPMPKGRSRRPHRVHPLVDELRGALKGANVDESDYKRHLEEKYL